MLGDNPQAQKSSKKSFDRIRKRRKTVTFTDPTYVDYSEIDYSSDEEDIDELFGTDATTSQGQQQAHQQTAQDETSDETARVEPLKTKKEAKTAGSAEQEDDDDEERNSEEIMDGRLEPSRSRNGTVRNTDSFFKDESVETKKITLTPNLLRDDSASRPSTDSVSSDKTKASRGSLDKMDKELVSDKDKRKQQQKDVKKDKDKKPGGIRSFFSRKDRKRSSEDDGDSVGKQSMETESRDSEDITADDPQSPEKAANRKLQKHQPRGDPSPTRKGSAGSITQRNYLDERTNNVSDVPPATMRIVDPDTQETQEVPSNQQQAAQRERSASGSTSTSGGGKSLVKSILPDAIVGSSEDKPQKAVQAKARMELDDSDSSDEGEALVQQASSGSELSLEPPQEKPSRPTLPGAFPDSYQTTTTVSTVSSTGTVQPYQAQQDRLSESPIEVSPLTPVGSHQMPELVDDNARTSPSPSSPSPELVQQDDASRQPQQQQQQPRQAQPIWDDQKLRAFFDDGDHIRDLLAVVYDKTDVEPAGLDHPVVGSLFREQNARLAEITTVSIRQHGWKGQSLTILSNWTICSGTGSQGSSASEGRCNART